MPLALRHDSPPHLLPADHAVFILDRRGHVIAVHEGETLFGNRRSHDLIGQHYASVYLGDRDDALLRTALHAHSAEPARVEAWLSESRDRRIRVEVSMQALKGGDGSVYGFAMFVRDTHLYKRLQTRLRENERRFRLFVHDVTDYAICMVDFDGVVLDWNLGAQRMTGYAAQAIVGQPIAIFFDEQQPADDLPAQLLRTAGQSGRANIGCDLKRADGECFPAEVIIEAVHEGDGSLLGFALIIHDQTQQQLSERRLHEAREQIVHAQKIEAIGHLTGGIAHDFNNALQGIISSLELASLSLDRHHLAQAKRHVMVSLDAALRAGRLTQRLLSLSRRQGSSSQRTSVAKVLTSMRELLDRTLGDDIVLEVSFPDELPPLACDSAQLESALVNLAVNARDAMAGHGRLSMSCRVCSPDDSSVQVTLDAAHSAYIEIAVADDGPGMSEETRKRAFEPFFTTKPEGRGTGLGLSMVFGFVTQYGGAVDIRSMQGAGTSVLLYLPCDEAVLETVPPKDTKPAPNLCGFRILVVEDNETIRHSVAARLRQLGCEVSEAASGDEALSILAGSPSWDLLLSDIDLPAMDGYELCCKAREQFPKLRVILMTGYADSKWLDSDELDGATEALIKPFDMGDLLAKAQLLLLPAD